MVKYGCVPDFRLLNKQLVKDTYCLPNPTDLLHSISKCYILSSMDLSSGFWQIKLDPRDTEKLAFCCFAGNYKYLKLPFGLANCPSIFQRTIDIVLSGLTYSAFVT